MISKSFAITGRVIDNGVRRLKQNVRHRLNIFMPRGVEPSADGWKLSLRNRMVHARVRWLFRNAEEWDHDAWGEPLSGAHMALASAVFSARMINYAVMLGPRSTTTSALVRMTKVAIEVSSVYAEGYRDRRIR